MTQASDSEATPAAVAGLPATMRAGVAYSFDDVRVERVALPVLEPGDALLRVRACGICTGDVTPWYITNKAKKHGGRVVVGHEPMGEIVALGPDAPGGFRLGDRVFAHHHAPCGETHCPDCARGNPVHCPTYRASALDPGGIAEYVRVPRANLARDTLVLPADAPDALGALVEPAACSVKAVRRAGIGAGDVVLQLGLGIMGQMNVALAADRGAIVIAADLIRWRAEQALAFGATHAVVPTADADGPLPEAVARLTGGRGADVVIVGPPEPALMELGIRVTARGGTTCFFMGARPGATLTLDAHRVYFDEVTLVSSYSCGPADTREAIAQLQAGVLPVERLVTHRFPLARFPEAFRFAATPGEKLKVLIEFPPESSGPEVAAPVTP